MIKQRLHATHNLMELLSAKHRGIPPTLRDDRLDEEVIHKYILYCQNVSIFLLFKSKLCFKNYYCSFFILLVSVGRAAATALHDQIRL